MSDEEFITHFMIDSSQKSMSFSTKILVIIGRQILIYVGLLIILIGMLGSFMIVLIFSRRPLNQNPCSIYITANGILSFFYLPLYFLPNILTFGFEVNWLALNTIYCKFLMSYGIFTVTSVFILNFFISFDRYAISSRSARVRALSSKGFVRKLIFIGLFLSWCLIGLPAAILFEVIETTPNGTSICTSKSTGFLLAAAFFYYPILEGILPILLTITFWYLTRKQVRNLNNQEFVQHFDRQITRMYFYQILACTVASVPFATINLYRSMTSQMIRSENQENVIQFIRLIAICLFYVQYSSDFYIYIFVSSEIREQTKRLFCFWRRQLNNRISILQTNT